MNDVAKIGWLVPPPIKGSGGIREIYNKIQYLCDRGHECHVYVDSNADLYTIIDEVEAYYGPNDGVLHRGWKYDSINIDMLFATIWSSAREVAKAPTHIKKAYLIQDYEAWFNPVGDAYAIAEQSYQLGLQSVCLGRWLPNKLHREWSIYSRFFDFCCDRNTYRSTTPYSLRDFAVCYIYQPEKPRRCSEIGLAALAMLKKRMPDICVYLFGSEEIGNVPFPHVNLGILKLPEINALYNRCAVGLCISSSNPSRIPFEMMSAGLPVVDIYRDNNLYDLPDAGVTLAEDNAGALAAALIGVLTQRDRRERMSAAGEQWMHERAMTKEYDQFYAAVNAVLSGEPVSASDLPAPAYKQPPVKDNL